MIEKIGVDISENSRFFEMIQDKKYYEKILSIDEIKIFEGFLHDKRKIEYIASRFSAKEALFKAYNKKFNFNEVSVLNYEDGSPYIKANFLNDYVTHISLSHEKEYSIAFVILEK